MSSLLMKCEKCVCTEKKCELMKLIVDFLVIDKTMKCLEYEEKRAKQTEETTATLIN